MKLFNELAAPFHLKGSDEHGVLLIHGFSGSPGKLRLLGEYLHGKGELTVHAILLRGHGTTPEEMRNASWADWLDDACSGYDELKSQCAKVYVAGFSMGGLLAILTAARREVERLVTIEAALGFRNKLVYAAPLLQHIVKKNRWPDFKQQFPDEAADYLLEYNVGYEEFYMKNVVDILRLNRLAGKILPSVTCPALIIQSRMDESIPASSARHIYDEIGSTNKRILWLERSRHNLSLIHI